MRKPGFGITWAATGILMAATPAYGSKAPVPAAGTVLPAAAPCAADALQVSLGQGNGAAGHFYVPIVFTNTGRACRITGYPDVSYFAGHDHHQVGDAAAREPGPTPMVLLRRGQSASAWVDQVNVDNYDPDECGPTAVTGLRVQLPGTGTAVLLAEPNARGCAEHMPGQPQLTVRPVHHGVEAS
ncbi:DUF4232 domain-containing protein [Amycolatopsis sp. NPDC059657]|uniref:DUF4232 domain-containing protein n=1 Tax=Amycolatopsis sp. NPDC059657 TaxID=3346899 RepID=UPI003670FAD6